MGSGTIRLYTRQNDKTLFMLEQFGRLLNQWIYVQLHFGDMARHYLDCYDWFAREAARIVPKPPTRSFPSGAPSGRRTACRRWRARWSTWRTYRKIR